MSGYLRDPDDARDKAHSWVNRYGSVMPIERQKSLWVPGMEMANQGSTNACTGYAGAYAMRMAIFHNEGFDPGPLSPLFLYYIGRAVWDAENRDGGSYLRTLFQAMQLQGACIDKLFSQEAGVLKKPTWRAIKNGFKHRGVRSYRLIESVDDARSALSRGVPLVGGWLVGTQFVQWSGGDPYSGEANPSSGHAMCVYGYDTSGDFLLANSYGPNVGVAGTWRVTPEFLMGGERLWACDTEEK